MLVGEVLDGFQLNKDLTVTNQIWDVGLLQTLAMVKESQLFLRFEGNRSGAQLDLHALLINRLHESVSLLAVHLESGTHDLIHLIFEWNVRIGLRKNFQPRIFTNLHEWREGGIRCANGPGEIKSSASELA